jgi:hypothetical protein
VSEGSSGDTQRLKCLNLYKEALKGNVSRVQTMYEGYMQNFSAKDGSLLVGSGALSNSSKEVA